VLPQDAESWKEGDLNRAIIHELEHVRRGDSISRSLARVACAVYWFHPLVWIAWRKLVLEAERSCDDAVLRRSEATAYADQLVGLARRISRARRSPLLAMANRDDLATRVGAVLDRRQRRGRAGTFSIVLACAIAAALVIVISPVIVVAAPQAGERTLPSSAQSPGSPLTFDVASVKPNKSDAPPSSNFPLNASPMYAANGGLFSATNFPLVTYIFFAYNLSGNQAHFLVPQLPGWVTTERFDIQARAAGNPTKDQMRLMMRSLLAERFRFASHGCAVPDWRRRAIGWQSGRRSVLPVGPGRIPTDLQQHPWDSSQRAWPLPIRGTGRDHRIHGGHVRTEGGLGAPDDRRHRAQRDLRLSSGI
jgi:hypothetical protein